MIVIALCYTELMLNVKLP